MDADPDRDESLAARIGGHRLAELRAELEGLGLEVIDVDELDRLRRESAAYQRMARLVEPPSDSSR